MTDDLKNILEKIKILEKKINENTEIVKDLRSHNRWSVFFKIFYWLVLFGLSYGLWQIIQPVIQSFSDTINSISQTGHQLNDSLNLDKLTELLDNLKNIKK